MKFQWVKLLKNSNFVPALVFPSEKGKKEKEAKTISTSGELAEKKETIFEVATQVQMEKLKRSRKSTAYLDAIKKFNEIHKTKFD